MLIAMKQIFTTIETFCIPQDTHTSNLTKHVCNKLYESLLYKTITSQTTQVLPPYTNAMRSSGFTHTPYKAWIPSHYARVCEAVVANISFVSRSMVQRKTEKKGKLGRRIKEESRGEGAQKEKEK